MLRFWFRSRNRNWRPSYPRSRPNWVVLNRLIFTYHGESVEKALWTLLTLFSGAISPFPGKGSSIAGQMAKPLSVASYDEICSEAFSTDSVVRVTKRGISQGQPFGALCCLSGWIKRGLSGGRNLAGCLEGGVVFYYS